MNRNQAKWIKGFAACGVVSLLAGCIVLSICPFYSPKDLVADPGLAGTWHNASKTNEIWQFAAAGEEAFLLTTVDENSTNCFEAHVFHLGQHQFLDLLTTNRAMLMLPLHLISKYGRNDTNLTLPFIDYGWLTRFLETNRNDVRHIVVPEKPGDTNGQVYLTSTTRELQKFLLKYVNDTNAFGKDSLVQLQR